MWSQEVGGRNEMWRSMGGVRWDERCGKESKGQESVGRRGLRRQAVYRRGSCGARRWAGGDPRSPGGGAGPGAGREDGGGSGRQ